MTHVHFVAASYAAAAIGLAGLFLWLLAERRRQLATLRQLQEHQHNQRQANASRAQGPLS